MGRKQDSLLWSAALLIVEPAEGMTQPTPLKNSPRQQADQRSDDRSTQQISEGALTPEHTASH
ncbi:MAG: hypothetical protein CL859_06120 [Cyanobium sp. ARS6]|nr:hypothetical protein [Cyanobium sp. ARS6]